MSSGQYGTLFHILAGLITTATRPSCDLLDHGGASVAVKFKTVAGFCVLRISTIDGADCSVCDVII